MTLAAGLPGGICPSMSMEIFARARPGIASTAEPAIQDIVARVRQPPGLRAALAAFRALTERAETVSAELRGTIAELAAAGGETARNASALLRKIRALDSQSAEMRDQVRTTLQNIVTERVPFAAAVAAALAPHRRAVARRALDAATTLDDALSLLDEVDAAMVAAGGSPGPRRQRGAIAAMVRQLRKLSE